MADVIVPFPPATQSAVENVQTELLRLKRQISASMTEIVLLQADLAVIGAQMAHDGEAHAVRVMDSSTACGRIWEMLR